MKINYRKAFLLFGGMLSSIIISAQELYVFTEPASNMPAHSISAKLSTRLLNNKWYNTIGQRYSPELMIGLSKNWMLHGVTTISNFYSDKLRWESAKAYAKYRILSVDEVHRHSRLAAFGEVSYSRNLLLFDEIAFDGDQSGIQGGLIFTHLTGKLALSTTASFLRVLNKKKAYNIGGFLPEKAFNYTLSAGYLVLPIRYTSFKQTNLNIYTELLGQRSIDLKKYSIDLAPAVQLIFNSNSKLNLGYRFQLRGDMRRMARQSWLISFETTFLNAFK